MKYLTTKLSFLFTLTLVFLASIWLLTQTLPLNQLTGVLNTQLTQLTQQPVKLSGDIKLKLLPKPSISIPLVELGKSEPESPYFAKLENLFFRISISQLLQGKVRFNELKVEHFHVQIYTPFKPVLSPHVSIFHSEDNLSFFQIKRLILGSGDVTVFHSLYTLNLNPLQLSAEQLSTQDKPIHVQLKTQIKVVPLGTAPEFHAQLAFKGETMILPSDLNSTSQLLNHLFINGQLNASSIQYGKLFINDCATTIKTNTTTILLNPLHFNLYGGESFGDLSIDPQIGQMLINQTGTNLRAAPLFESLFSHVPMSGSLDFSIHAALKYLRPMPLKNLSGNGNFTIREGFIHSFNLNVLVDYAKAFIHHLLSTTTSSPPPAPPMHAIIFQQQTPFRLLSLDYHLNNTKLISNNFIFQNDNVEVNGTGNYDINTQYVHASFTAQLDNADEQVNRVQRILGGNFPLKIRGWIKHPQVTPDMPKLSPHLQQLVVDKVMLSPLHDIQQQFKNLFQFNEFTSD